MSGKKLLGRPCCDFRSVTTSMDPLEETKFCPTRHNFGWGTQRACGAGGSIKPRVERSGTLGMAVMFLRARETGDSRSIHLSTLPPATRAVRPFAPASPGFRFAPPWALCFRLLRRLPQSRKERRFRCPNSSIGFAEPPIC